MIIQWSGIGLEFVPVTKLEHKIISELEEVLVKPGITYRIVTVPEETSDDEEQV